MRKVCFLALFLALWGCGGRDVEVVVPNGFEEPDRRLYETAMHELDESRWNVARLTLQTLINTYPDSEYLPQAKYALAESFYREGTTSMLSQAQIEFMDFITFFPTSEYADDAQLMVAMTHVRQMEKSDRDPTQALFAELELQNMIRDYPDSPLLDEAKEKLRAVQEVLAEGIHGIGNFYFIRRSYVSAIDRYKEVMEKYPDYSKMSEVYLKLAESLTRFDSEEDPGQYYARIVTDYPLSEEVKEAKERLTAMNLPIPEPNPVAIARAQENRPVEKGLFDKVFSMFSRRPDVSTETDAASVRDDDVPEEEEQRGPGSFRIEPVVVPPGQRPPQPK